MVGDEWASVCTACFHVQNWCFHFDELVVVQRFAETGNRGVTNLKCAACLFVDDQVGVSLAIASINIGESVPLIGQRSHGFGQQLGILDFDRQLAFACGHH